MTAGQKLTDEQRAEIVRRYNEGETSPKLATAFSVSPKTILKVVHKANGTGPTQPTGRRRSPAMIVQEFAKRAKSILWR